MAVFSTILSVHFVLSNATSEIPGSFPLQVIKEQRFFHSWRELSCSRDILFALCTLLISQHFPSASFWKDLMPWKQTKEPWTANPSWIWNCTAAQSFKMSILWVTPGATSAFFSHASFHKVNWDRKKALTRNLYRVRDRSNLCIHSSPKKSLRAICNRSDSSSDDPSAACAVWAQQTARNRSGAELLPEYMLGAWSPSKLYWLSYISLRSLSAFQNEQSFSKQVFWASSIYSHRLGTSHAREFTVQSKISH